MAKSPEVETPQPQPAAVGLTIEQLKELLREVKAPYVDPEKVRQAQEAKRYWQEQQQEAAAQKAARENACSHIRPEDGKSRFHWMPFQQPQGAWYGVCNWCWKEIRNYEEYKDEATGKTKMRLCNNPEYDYWRKVPTGIING